MTFEWPVSARIPATREEAEQILERAVADTQAKVKVEPARKLVVRDLQGVAFAEVIQLPGLVLLRVGDRDLAMTPQTADKLAAALGVVAEAVRR